MTEISSADTAGIRPETLPRGKRVLTINGGSSSLKFALYRFTDELKSELSGKVDRIGLKNSSLSVKIAGIDDLTVREIPVTDYQEAVNVLFDQIEKEKRMDALIGVGHRVVHGGPNFSAPRIITPDLVRELTRISPFSPEHLPAQIRLIEALTHRYTSIPQIACFDTAFHSNMPQVARILPIPRRFFSKGIRRYGFHGLSYEFLLEELKRLAGPDAAMGRVILAHFGNGSSLAAVLQGKCIDTSMGFTPTAGLPMSTRSGDLDPGLFLYLTRQEGMTGEEFNEMVNRQSGLLGVSEISPDLRDLLARQAQDPRAADAVDLFCYQAKKWIGAFAAALQGVDTLVFSGGIGENAPEIRERICAGLKHLGIQLDDSRNRANAATISSDQSPSTVRVIRTDEEQMIARAVCRILRVHEPEPASGLVPPTSIDSIS